MLIFQKRGIFWVVGIVALLVCLSFFVKPVKNVLYLISSPFNKVFQTAGSETADFLAGFFRAKSLKSENQELTKENFDLKQQIAAWQRVEEENEILRKALELNLGKEFRLEFVEVLSKETANDTLLIKGGRDMGFKEGMPLITEEKILIGTIEDVLGNFSRAVLVSQSGQTFDVEIFPNLSVSAGNDFNASSSIPFFEAERPLLGVVLGEGALTLSFDKASREREIQEGDLVFSSNLSGKLPRGLLVGQVIEIDKEKTAPFQKGRVSPFFTQSSLNQLFIIKDFADSR